MKQSPSYIATARDIWDKCAAKKAVAGAVAPKASKETYLRDMKRLYKMITKNQPLDFRAIITARLVELDKTIYWLQKQMEVYGSRHPHMLRYLKGGEVVNADTLGRMCGILGLSVKGRKVRQAAPPPPAPDTPQT